MFVHFRGGIPKIYPLHTIQISECVFLMCSLRSIWQTSTTMRTSRKWAFRWYTCNIGDDFDAFSMDFAFFGWVNVVVKFGVKVPRWYSGPHAYTSVSESALNVSLIFPFDAYISKGLKTTNSTDLWTNRVLFLNVISDAFLPMGFITIKVTIFGRHSLDYFFPDIFTAQGCLPLPLTFFGSFCFAASHWRLIIFV